jgi:hypothetical protein
MVPVEQVLNSTDHMLDIWNLVNQRNLVTTWMNYNRYSRANKSEGEWDIPGQRSSRMVPMGTKISSWV